ncbi:hypothetical protein LTR08_007122 [Meristemomyces frigidus]|nr:hypothetical protein LTR08_007122 [Meristemomyces frigidus]
MFDQDADDGTVAADGPAVAQDIGWQALEPAIAFTILSTAVVVLRWYTRYRLVRCVGWDDYVILLSLILSWSSTAIIATAVASGVGLLDGPDQPTNTIILILANNDLWALTVTVTKISILMQYLRIFSGRTTRSLCYLLLFCLLPFVCWAILGGTLLCNPARKLWMPQVEGTCRSAQTYWLSVAGTNIALDFLVLLLPMPAIAPLRLARKQKAPLVLVFLLGFCICGVSLARLATVFVISEHGELVVSGIWAIIWSTVEANVGIICASLLALKPLIAALFPKLVEEEKGAIPKYCMQVRTVRGDEAGEAGDGDEDRGRKRWRSADEATLVEPPTPSTVKTQEEIQLKRCSAATTSPGEAERRGW